MSKRRPLLVSAGILFRNGQVLVGQRKKGGRHSLKWEFPGGKVEHGESPRQGLIRELREELSIEAKIGAELARYEHAYPSGSRVQLMFFAVREFTGALEAVVFEQIQWVDLLTLPTIDFLEGDIDFVNRLSRGDFKKHLV